MPELDEKFDIFIPVNELIWRIKKIIIKSISDINAVSLDMNQEYVFINKDTSKIYNNNEIVRETDIRNGTELIFVKK